MTAAHPSVIPALTYKDPRAALEWLQNAFGFEVEMLIEDENGNLAHSQLRFGDGLMMVGAEWHPSTKSPTNFDGACTTTTRIHLESGIDEHCERARAAGAEILMAPETQFYGDRTYRARDLEGHMWTFSQTVEAVSPSDWEKTTGLKAVIGGDAS